jgi:hypothetical protein
MVGAEHYYNFVTNAATPRLPFRIYGPEVTLYLGKYAQAATLASMLAPG